MESMEAGEEVKLPHREFELLVFLAKNPNIVFSKEALFEKIWGIRLCVGCGNRIGAYQPVKRKTGRRSERSEDHRDSMGSRIPPE